VLDVHAHKVESVEEVVKRIKLALEFLPPEKIYVDPDCGLKTSTWERLRPRSRS
jgi:5-methyltetrahydropteroyltriglutamate--homocysteine methyltransferase